MEESFAEKAAAGEIAVVFSSGLGLASYHAGAFEALARSSDAQMRHRVLGRFDRGCIGGGKRRSREDCLLL
jgi:hypothetical protein